jgi:hypothetical protein
MTHHKKGVVTAACLAFAQPALVAAQRLEKHLGADAI